MKTNYLKAGGLLFMGACFSVNAATVTVLNFNAPGWKYLVGTQEASNPTDAWRVPAFNDASWSTGTAPIGYPTTPPDSALEGTLTSGTVLPTGTVGGYTCVFLRHPVVINNPATLAQLTLTVRYDDGYVVWFNGVELGRSSNVPPGPPNVGTLTTSEREVTNSEDVFNISASLLLAGSNMLAIQVFNGAESSSDLFIDARLVGTVDDVAPAIVSLNPPSGATVPQLNVIHVTFSEPVANVDAADLLVNGVPALDVTMPAPNLASFQFLQPATGTVSVAFAPTHGITDLASPPNAFAGGNWNYTLDPNLMVPFLITEFLASNSGQGTNALRDEDGESSDWIEIRNPSALVGNLGGWFLTDEQQNLTKWRFPDGTTIPALGYLVVFASNKNRTNPAARLHTNFRLDAGPPGEFLALVDPNTNVISAFSPAYPTQQTDVSYGRDRANASLTGYFVVPTPGADNVVAGAGFGPETKFSRTGGTFVNSFLLTLSTEDPNASIRYNLVNTGQTFNTATNIPTSASTLYTGPIPISGTVQVRARAFSSVPNSFPGPVRTECFILVSNSVANFTSTIPIVVIHTMGSGGFSAGNGAPDTSATVAFFDTDCGYSAITNKPSLIKRAGINIRGASTQGYAKSSWAVELWDEFNADEHVEVLGLPAESDWVLYAPNSFDLPQMHNPLYYALGRMAGQYASRTRFVEVFVRTTGNGPITANMAAVGTGMGDYNGLYVLEEKIKRDNDRVDMEKLEPEQTNSTTITGGYLLKIDRIDSNERGFNAGGFTADSTYGLCFQDPDGLEMVTPARRAQSNYIASYLNLFNATLSGANLTNGTGTNHYSYYFDVKAGVEHTILGCVALNADSMRLSGFFYKARGKKLTMGPIWDCDRGLGTGLDRADQDWRSYNPRCWTSSAALGVNGGDFGTDYFNANNVFANVWYARLCNDPDFWQAWIDRYQELRSTTWTTNAVVGLVDQFAREIAVAQPRNQARWGGNGDGHANCNPRTGSISAYLPTPPYTNIFPGTFKGELDFQKKWFMDRLNFIDTNFLGTPAFSLFEGPVQSGTNVTIFDTSGKPGTKIYYTLDGTDPRAPQNRTNVVAQEYTGGPIPITTNVRIVARALNPNHRNQTGTQAPGGPNHANPPISSIWSAPMAASYYVSTPPVRITEIMYHPQSLPADGTNDADNFEFVELKNIGSSPVNLNRYRLRGGVDVDFGPTVLAPGGYCVAVKDVNAFRLRYSSGPVIAGVFTNDNLANDSDTIRLEGSAQEPILDFVYFDNWYPATDGSGFSLQIVNENAATSSWGLKESWRPSSEINGTPGRGEATVISIPTIYVNEVLPRPPAGQSSAIELFNATASEVNIGGWFLTDEFDTPKKYRIPDGTTIPGNGVRVFTANTSFGVAFNFDVDGEQVYLFSADAAGNLTGYSHGFDFGRQVPNGTFGRYTISTGNNQFPAQAATTIGSANTGPRIGPVIVSEISFHPPEVPTVEGPRDNDKDEFIELQNITGANQPLYDPNFPANTWRLNDGVNFTFPPNVVIPAGGFIIVTSIDPSDSVAASTFRTRNGIPAGIPLYGPWSGQLDNSADTIELLRPDAPGAGGVDYLLVERVRYEDVPPWPSGADGLGPTLQRAGSNTYGNDPGNWVAARTTPGGSYVSGAPPVITQQPVNTSAVLTHPATFSVLASGPGPLTYQWRHNGVVVTGATNTILLIQSVTVDDGGLYNCVVLNSSGVAISSNAQLTVRIPATITAQPQDVLVRVRPDPTAAPTTNATFTVGATSQNPPLTYQWRFNGTNIPGANSTTLTFNNVTTNDYGVVSCAISDTVGTIFTTSATLYPLVRPGIVSQTPNQFVAPGTLVGLSCVVTGYPPPFGFEWRLGSVGIVSNTINGTINNFTLVATNVPFITNQYRVVVKNLANLTPGVPSGFISVITLPDTDGDGILDSVEDSTPGFDKNNPADATADFDGDGINNRDELIAGTSPNDPASFLKVEGTAAPGVVSIRFLAAAGKTYTIEYTDTLGSGVWRKLADVPPGAGGMVSVMDFTTGLRRYYRIATPGSSP